MKFLSNLIPYKLAKEIVFENLDILTKSKYKKIKTEKSLNKICFENIYSPENLPMFNKSAMDGYAVISEDTVGASDSNPIILDLVNFNDNNNSNNNSNNSNTINNYIEEGQCVKISTGMALPKGANGVVMKEYANEEDGFVEIKKGIYNFENVSKIGEDVKKGDLILKKGETINSYHIALLLSLGIKEIKILNLKIGILSTGDELINIDKLESIEQLKKEGKIVNSNTPMLYNLIKDSGFKGKKYNLIEDNEEKLKNKILEIIKENDVVFTTGGTSVGDRDYTIKVIKELCNLKFHGVKIRPGKPFGFATFKYNGNYKLIYVLSGYPVASAIQYELFFRNYFKKRTTIYMPLNRNIPSTLGRTDILRLKFINNNEKNITAVEPLKIGGSGVLSSIAKSQCYTIINENIEGYEKGEFIKVYLL